MPTHARSAQTGRRPALAGVVLALALALPAAAADRQPLRAAPSAAQITAAADAGEMLVIDIRRPEEWRATGVLPGARLITDDGTDPDALRAAIEALRRPGQPVALICRTGNRTARASAQLAPLIDAPVIDVAGGMLRLIDEGLRPAAPTRAQGCTTC